jgi:hypothetical protein
VKYDNSEKGRCRAMKNATRQFAVLSQGVIAGAAGGLAEVAWVTFYAGVTGGDPAVLARGVTSAAGVSALLPTSPATLGAGIHMSLAVALGVALSFAWSALRECRSSLTNPYPLMLAVLAAVWAVNFFIVLPVVSPAFVHMVPYAVSLTSKLLFGAAAAEVLRRQPRTMSSLAPVAVRKRSDRRDLKR